MYSFYFRDTKCVPLVAVFHMLGLGCKERKRLLKKSDEILCQADTIVDTVYVVSNVAPEEIRFLFDGRDGDDTTVLLTEEGVEKVLLSFSVIIKEDLYKQKQKPKLRRIK
jgi:hypothetical protein